MYSGNKNIKNAFLISAFVKLSFCASSRFGHFSSTKLDFLLSTSVSASSAWKLLANSVSSASINEIIYSLGFIDDDELFLWYG